MAAVRQIGPAAVPTLLRLLSAKDIPWVNAIKQKGIDKGFTDINGKWAPNEARRRHNLANVGFSVLGPLAEGAVPGLITELANPDPEVRIIAVRALGRIGPAAESAVPALRRALNDTDSLIQDNAAGAISLIRQRVAAEAHK